MLAPTKRGRLCHEVNVEPLIFPGIWCTAGRGWPGGRCQTPEAGGAGGPCHLLWCADAQARCSPDRDLRTGLRSRHRSQGEPRPAIAQGRRPASCSERAMHMGALASVAFGRKCLGGLPLGPLRSFSHCRGLQGALRELLQGRWEGGATGPARSSGCGHSTPGSAPACSAPVASRIGPTEGATTRSLRLQDCSRTSQHAG